MRKSHRPCEYADRRVKNYHLTPHNDTCNLYYRADVCLPMQGAYRHEWFRSNIKHGTRLALLALLPALQFVMGFGHFRRHSASRARHPFRRGAVEICDRSCCRSRRCSSPRPTAWLRSRQQAIGRRCAICAVITLANTLLFSMPPLLLLPQAVEFCT